MKDPASASVTVVIASSRGYTRAISARTAGGMARCVMCSWATRSAPSLVWAATKRLRLGRVPTTTSASVRRRSRMMRSSVNRLYCAKNSSCRGTTALGSSLPAAPRSDEPGRRSTRARTVMRGEISNLVALARRKTETISTSCWTERASARLMTVLLVPPMP